MTDVNSIYGATTPKPFKGNLIVSALILTHEQKQKLDELVAKTSPLISVEHATNGLTHIYSLSPENLNASNVDLIWTLKSILAPNQYARIMKLVYGLDSTFWVEITDISATQTLPVQEDISTDLYKNLSHEWTAKMDLDIEDITDALTQIPESEQHKILEFSGITEWRNTTVEEWTGISLFRISEENLAELREHFTDLYDWSAGDGHTEIKFHRFDLDGETFHAITGLFTDHATLNEDYISKNNLSYDDFEESINLIDLLKQFAEPNQKINLTVAGMDSKKCYFFVSDIEI